MAADDHVNPITFVCVCSSIFGHDGQDAEDVVYVNWLSMVRAGLLGLEFYTPESKSWRQVLSPTDLPFHSLLYNSAWFSI